MVKWLDEKILIRYWEDRYSHYHLSDGRSFLSVRRNPNFGAYPDIIENELSDHTRIPLEIEWYTTNFDLHHHDVNLLRSQNGILLVFQKNASFAVEQIEIDSEDFRTWFCSQANVIVEETIQAVQQMARRSDEPEVYLFYVPGTLRSRKNFKKALENGVWGFPENEHSITRGLSKIQQIREGDILIFVHQWKKSEHLAEQTNIRGRVSSKNFVGMFDQIVGVTVTKGYYREDDHPIWEDSSYPHRVEFRKDPLFVGKQISCNKRALGKSLHEILRILMTNGTIEKIDATLLVKLLSLCSQS